jgi:hypothetical protein
VLACVVELGSDARRAAERRRPQVHLERVVHDLKTTADHSTADSIRSSLRCAADGPQQRHSRSSGTSGARTVAFRCSLHRCYEPNESFAVCRVYSSAKALGHFNGACHSASVGHAVNPPVLLDSLMYSLPPSLRPCLPPSLACACAAALESHCTVSTHVQEHLD